MKLGRGSLLVDKNFLLTHKYGQVTDFSWFGSEEELKNFVSENDVEVLDALEVGNCREVCFDE